MDLSEKVSSRMGAGSLGGEALWRYQMDGRNEAVCRVGFRNDLL